jgi:hypothetical protein
MFWTPTTLHVSNRPRFLAVDPFEIIVFRIIAEYLAELFCRDLLHGYNFFGRLAAALTIFSQSIGLTYPITTSPPYVSVNSAAFKTSPVHHAPSPLQIPISQSLLEVSTHSAKFTSLK